MTIWLEKFTVKEYIVEPTGSEATIEFDVDDGRCTARVEFTGPLTFESFGVDRWEELLSCLRDGNPEIEVKAENGSVIVELTTDENVYRPE